MGGFAPPFIYTEIKKAHEVALSGSKAVVFEVWKDFERSFGRQYHQVEEYRADGARMLLLTMGSYSETAMLAVDRMRENGMSIGLLKLRLWRPFPFSEIRESVKDAETLIVLDRALSTGGPGGPVASEIRSAFYHDTNKPKIVSFVGGLGGRDVSPFDFEKIVKRGIELAESGKVPDFEMYGVKE